VSFGSRATLEAARSLLWRADPVLVCEVAPALLIEQRASITAALRNCLHNPFSILSSLLERHGGRPSADRRAIMAHSTISFPPGALLPWPVCD
jgi:hypothetical protein